MSLFDKIKTELAYQMCLAGTGDFLNLVYMDLDRFVYHNDSFGHASGDRVMDLILRNLAFLAQKHVATVNRVGGDELLLYQFKCRAGRFSRLGENAQAIVHNLKIPLVSADYMHGSVRLPEYMTCGVVAVSYLMEQKSIDSPTDDDIKQNQYVVDALLGAADESLAYAKRSGYGVYTELYIN